MTLLGQTLGQYQIIEQLGQGGMGAVFKAYQPGLDRYVALKIMLPGMINNSTLQERFQREARAIANLNHPNILPVYDFGSQGQYSYIAMRYIEGGRTLKEVMARPFSLAQAAPFIEQVAAALEAAHARGIIHRDVKPANVLMDGDWALLSDFGLAKVVEGSAKLTGTGMSIGTPAYMSPEQGQGQAVDYRTDIYALGVILFEMLTGQIPHDAPTPFGIILKRATEPAPLLRQLKPHLPEAAEQIMLKALAFNPDERFLSALALARALKTVALELLPEAAPDQTVLSPGSFTPPSPPVFAYPPLTHKPATPAATPPGSVSIPPPPEPSRPSLPARYVGRKAELAAYADRLAADHLAVITGMAGVGKTNLALRLAYQVAEPERIFWYSLHEDEGVEAIIWSLAAFLARRERAELWQMLQSARLTGGQPPPLDVLIDYILQAIRGQNFLLCLDDLHHLQDDPELVTLLKRLWPAVQAGETAMIITSRRVLDLAPAGVGMALAGLSRADTARLLSQNGLTLPAGLVAELHAGTEGNAALLMLAIDLLKRAGEPEPVLARLASADNIERYLVKEVDGDLGEEERATLVAVAILLGYPGSREAIETISERPRLKRAILELSDRYLLAVEDSDMAELYAAHAIIRGFY